LNSDIIYSSAKLCVLHRSGSSYYSSISNCFLSYLFFFVSFLRKLISIYYHSICIGIGNDPCKKLLSYILKLLCILKLFLCRQPVVLFSRKLTYHPYKAACKCS